MLHLWNCVHSVMYTLLVICGNIISHSLRILWRILREFPENSLGIVENYWRIFPREHSLLFPIPWRMFGEYSLKILWGTFPNNSLHSLRIIYSFPENSQGTFPAFPENSLHSLPFSILHFLHVLSWRMENIPYHSLENSPENSRGTFSCMENAFPENSPGNIPCFSFST